MVRDDGHTAAGDECRPQRRQPQLELLELLIHHDAKRLKQAREVRRPRARAQCLADRVHKVVTRDERRVAPRRKVNPRSAVSSWWDDTPRSSRMRSGRNAATVPSTLADPNGPVE